MGQIRPPALCVLGVKRPVSRNEVKDEWKCTSIILSGFMDDIGQFYLFIRPLVEFTALMRGCYFRIIYS